MALRRATDSNYDTADMRSKTSSHVKLSQRERLEYYKMNDKATLQAKQFCSIIVDGAINRLLEYQFYHKNKRG